MEILTVDDSNLIQIRLEYAIKKIINDVTLHKAMNCEEAEKQLLLLNPDLVILDISLPDGSGIDILRNIKKQTPLLPVFMFTSFPTGEFKKSCLELGADAFFDKSNFSGLMHSIDLLHKNLIKMS